LPFLAGERAPNWNADARGTILGLTLNTRPIEILRAGMEAVAYRLGLVYEMVHTITTDAKAVIASGGALEKSPTWVQMIADVLNARVIASAESEATSRGCALIALKELGLIKSFEDVPAALGRAYVPDLSRHEIYARAMERQKRWYNLLIKEQG
jgi:gluconokinase